MRTEGKMFALFEERYNSVTL